MSKITSADFVKVANDVNGNPRYVCHFLLLDVHGFDKGIGFGLGDRYALACKLANRAGGRKYHTKSFGGGIVFQSYALDDTCARLNELVEEARQAVTA
jgi:hypothetical protein